MGRSRATVSIVLSLFACREPARPPAAPEPPITIAAPPVDAAAPMDAPVDAAIDAPVDARPDAALVTEKGTLRTENGRCYAPDELVARCRAMKRPAGWPGCAVAPPVGYWDGPRWCRGAAPQPGDEKWMDLQRDQIASREIPACQCMCEPGWVAAQKAKNEHDRGCGLRK
jgi:hypothetical protein